MEQKKDLRVIKTNNNIRSTFIALLNEKDFDSITVQNILDRALINRTTFYKHYSDKYNLAETIAKYFFDEFKSLLDIRFLNNEDSSNLFNRMDKICKAFYDERATLLGLWKIHTEKLNLYEDMQIMLKQRYIDFAKNYVKKDWNIEYQACIFASIALTNLKFMLENEKIFSIHELTKELLHYIELITTASIKK